MRGLGLLGIFGIAVQSEQVLFEHSAENQFFRGGHVHSTQMALGEFQEENRDLGLFGGSLDDIQGVRRGPTADLQRRAVYVEMQPFGPGVGLHVVDFCC